MSVRLGFLGIGWIGLDRMKAVLADGSGEVAAICDPSDEARGRALEVAPDAAVVPGLEAMLDLDLDGVVIATPSALHAEQSVAALERGVAVFCQKPLGRTSVEVARVVDSARAADRRLGVDLSYRHTRALGAVRDLVRSGELGEVYAVEVVFHNAYGPDKEWYRDRARSGGGCVMDLGIHLVDAALWCLDFPEVEDVRSRLWAEGQLLGRRPDRNEDHAVAEIHLEGGRLVRLTCSWWLPAGRDAVIGAELWGTAGGACLRNVDGSFYDFVGERFRGTQTERLVEPPDAWGGRALVDWARELASDPGFDPEAERLVRVHEVLDAIYGV